MFWIPGLEKGRKEGGRQRGDQQRMPSHRALVRCVACHTLTRSTCHGARIRSTERGLMCANVSAGAPGMVHFGLQLNSQDDG